jgi:hypothetical protein
MEGRYLQRSMRAWPIRWRILAIAALNSALAVVLILLIWDGAQVLARAWADLRQVRQTERFLDQLDRDTERLQTLIHRYIGQAHPDVLARIGDLRDTLIGRLRVQARLDPLIAAPAERLREVTERFIDGFSALRDTRARIQDTYETGLAQPAREMSGLYAMIEGRGAADPTQIWPPLAKSRESFHTMMLAANAFQVAASTEAADEMRRAAAAIRRTVPVMLDDVLERGAVRKQVEALEHHRDLGAHRADLPLGAVHARSVHPDLAAVVGFEPVDAAQERRLARAGRPDDADHLTLRHPRGDALEHRHRPEMLADAVEFDHGRPARFSRWRTIRIRGRLSTRYISATRVKTLVFLKVAEAISLPCSASSATVMVEACEESFSIMIITLP